MTTPTRKPDGYIAYFKGDASRYGEFNAGKYVPVCLKREDLEREYGANSSWQIRPIWLSTEPPITPGLIAEIVECIKEFQCCIEQGFVVDEDGSVKTLLSKLEKEKEPVGE